MEPPDHQPHGRPVRHRISATDCGRRSASPAAGRSASGTCSRLIRIRYQIELGPRMPSTRTSAALQQRGGCGMAPAPHSSGRPSPRRGSWCARSPINGLASLERALGGRVPRRAATVRPAGPRLLHSGPRVAAVGEALRHGVEGELFGPAVRHLVPQQRCRTPAHQGWRAPGRPTPWCGPWRSWLESTNPVPFLLHHWLVARFGAPALDFARHSLRPAEPG